jgi:hypothetical protein
MRIFIWCLEPESNRHGGHPPRDFKSLVSTNFTIQAKTFVTGFSTNLEAEAGIEPA